MASQSKLEILLTLKDHAGGQLDGITGKLGGLGKAAGVAGLAVGAGFLAAGGLAIKAGLDFNTSMEQNQIAFETMMGSADKASAHLKELQALAKNTPFEQADVIKGSRQLQAYGFEAEKIIPMLTTIGDAASGLGLGAEGVDRIVRAMGQMRAKGKLSAEDMMQITELGVGGWQMVADSMGKTTAEVMDMTSKGLIPADKAIQALLSGMGAKFPDMMAKQSQSMAGMMSTLKDTFSIAVGEMTEPIFKQLKPALNSFLELISSPKFDEFITKLSEGIGGAMGAAGQALSSIDWTTVFTTVGDVVGTLVTAFQNAWPYIQQFGQFMMDVAIPAAIQFGKDAYALAQTIIAFLAPTIAEVSAKVRQFATEVLPMIGPAIAGIQTMIANFVTMWQANWWWIRDIVEGVWKTIQGIIEVAWALITGNIKIGLALLAGDWDGAGKALQEMTGKIWAGIGTIIGGQLQSIDGLLNAAWALIQTAAGAAWKAIGDAMFNAINASIQAIINGVTSAINWIIDRVNDVIRSVNAIKIQVPTINLPGGGTAGGNTIGMPQLGTLSRIETTNVYINAPVYGVSQLEDVVVGAVESAQRRGRLAYSGT